MHNLMLFNLFVLFLFALFFFKDRQKGKEVVRLAIKSAMAILPLLIIALVFMMFLDRIFSQEWIISYLSDTKGIMGYLLAAFLGAIVHVPLFISFPLGGELLKNGVNPGFIAVLITSLVMVHTFSIPIEIKELGLKFAIIRNSLSLVFAIIIGIIVGVLY